MPGGVGGAQSIMAAPYPDYVERFFSILKKRAFFTERKGVCFLISSEPGRVVYHLRRLSYIRIGLADFSGLNS